jgi:hypothetical protein
LQIHFFSSPLDAQQQVPTNAKIANRAPKTVKAILSTPTSWHFCLLFKNFSNWYFAYNHVSPCSATPLSLQIALSYQIHRETTTFFGFSAVLRF